MHNKNNQTSVMKDISEIQKKIDETMNLCEYLLNFL